MCMFYNNIFSQTENSCKYNFIASTIKNEYVKFTNDKDRVFVLVANLSCSNCLKNCAIKLTELKSQLNDSSEHILIMQGDSLNVMSNRTKISALSKIFQEIDYFLFDYNAENETLLDINKYELKDFPVLIIVFKASNDICIIKYPDFANKSIMEILSNICK